MRAIASRVEEGAAVFRVRFWRSYKMLDCIAHHICRSPARMDEAIESCWYIGHRNAPHFEYEGQFRGWLLRGLMEEALALLVEASQYSAETYEDYFSRAVAHNGGAAPYHGDHGRRALRHLCRRGSDGSVRSPSKA